MFSHKVQDYKVFRAMWTKMQFLVFDIMLGLRKALKTVGLRRELSEEQQKSVANVIANDLVGRANWKFEKGPPAEPH